MMKEITNEGDFDLERERAIVLEKALAASEVLKKADTKILEIWNLVIAEKRLYIKGRGKKDVLQHYYKIFSYFINILQETGGVIITFGIQ
jgi:hypothetical protein